jgi:Inner centromere protein, ARK binding region
LGAAQPLSRSLIGHALPTNPAKPAKRPLEEDVGPSCSQSARFTAATQPGDAKRRKTDDENVIEAPRPTMSGAPIRQSNLGKKPSIFNYGSYASVQPQPHLGQFQQPPNPRMAHPSVMSQFGNGAKIPFADAPNAPSHAAKTPVSAYQQKTLQLVKSSPQYQNGESIHLPEIATDSEDEDSDKDNSFPIPDWATPGHLTDQLIRQEGIDGDAVFGPIAPLKMEEIFTKGNKERLKRMRDRTSSANWAMSGDGLTLEEIRIDREQRERMRLEGGWRYGT